MDIPHCRLRDLALSDSGFVFDPQTGHTFTVNSTGQLALRCLKDGMSAAEIEQHTRQAFSIDDLHDPARDLQDFMLQLRDCGLVK